MDTKRTSSDDRDVFARNPKIDVASVKRFRKLDEELEKLGVVVKPTYRLEHPLDSSRYMPHNRSR